MINKKYLDELKKTSAVLEWTIKAASDNEKKYLDYTKADIKKAVEDCKKILVIIKKLTGEKIEVSSGIVRYIQDFDEKVRKILEQYGKLDRNELRSLSSIFKYIQDAEQVRSGGGSANDEEYQRNIAQGKAIAEKYFELIDEMRKMISDAQDILEKIFEEDRNAFSALDAELRTQLEQILNLFLTLEISIFNVYLQLSYVNTKKMD